ncbi:MAG: PEP-CTERM sorting domain-containing protein [Pirellulales bacterium]
MLATAGVRLANVTSSRFVHGSRPAARFAQLTLFALVIVWAETQARAVTIDFGGGGLVINDNGVGDTNATIGIIDFNTTFGGYKLSGTVDTAAGPSIVSLLGSPSAALRLTNFTAEAVGTPGPLGLQFYDTVAGFFPSVTGADSLDAYVGHATGAPVPPANDLILDWQGFISGVVITGVSPGPPPYPNPFLPPASAPLPYSLVTHGPTAMGAFLNPVFGAYLTFQLGSNGDQLILPSSGEVGVHLVPEPSTIGLLATGVSGLFLLVFRRRARDATR